MCACLTACLLLVCLHVCLPGTHDTDRQTYKHPRSRQTDRHAHIQTTRGKCVGSCLGHLDVHRPPLRAICGVQPFCPAQVLQLNALPPVQPCLEDELGGGGQGPLQPVVVQRAGLAHCHPLCTKEKIRLQPVIVQRTGHPLHKRKERTSACRSTAYWSPPLSPPLHTRKDKKDLRFSVIVIGASGGGKTGVR